MTWLRAHWRQLAAALAVVAAFALGRAGRPEPRVETRVEYRDRIEWRDRIVEKRVEVAVRQEAKVVTRWRTITKAPDGGTVEQSGEREEAAAKSVAGSSSLVDASTEGQAERSGASSTVTEPYRPQWRAGLLAGADLPERELVLGAQVEHRVAGPFWAGVQATKGGTVAVIVSAEF